jgi:hypothetical protein
MKNKVYTFKNVTLIFKFDKDSKYYLDGDNVIQLDNNWMQKQCYNVWDSLDDKRSKVIQDYDNVLLSISDKKFNDYKKSTDMWVDRKLKEYNVKPTGLNILNKLLK